ncbi:ABC transporter permease [Frateuria aurantia]
MWGYAFRLALKGLGRFPKSSTLAVLTVALGLAATMSTLTLLHVLSADPLPGRSQYLYSPYVDTVQGKLNDIWKNPDTGVRWQMNVMKPADARALLDPARSNMQAAINETRGDISADGIHSQRNQDLLLTTHGFAAMFGLPLQQGRFWDAGEETSRLAVLGADLARSLFGQASPIGKLIHIGHADFQVIGVAATYRPEPHFYAMDSSWTFDANRQDDVFLPVQAAVEAGVAAGEPGSCDNNAKAGTGMLGSLGQPRDLTRCEWLIPWVALDTPAQLADYRAFVSHYAEDHRPLGRKPLSRLDSVAGWMRYNHVIPDHAQLNLWLAAAFLLLCMVNVAGLLTARFLRRSHEVSIRRAIGATRRDIFAQYLLESCGVCIVGGLLALPLTHAGLWILRHQDGDYNALARMDPSMFAGLFAIAALTGVVVGLIPAWRATRVSPGLHLKAS